MASTSRSHAPVRICRDLFWPSRHGVRVLALKPRETLGNPKQAARARQLNSVWHRTHISCKAKVGEGSDYWGTGIPFCRNFVKSSAGLGTCGIEYCTSEMASLLNSDASTATMRNSARFVLKAPKPFTPLRSRFDPGGAWLPSSVCKYNFVTPPWTFLLQLRFHPPKRELWLRLWMNLWHGNRWGLGTEKRVKRKIEYTILIEIVCM